MAKKVITTEEIIEDSTVSPVTTQTVTATPATKTVVSDTAKLVLGTLAVLLLCAVSFWAGRESGHRDHRAGPRSVRGGVLFDRDNGRGFMAPRGQIYQDSGTTQKQGTTTAPTVPQTQTQAN